MCFPSVAFSNREQVQERGNVGLNHVMKFQGEKKKKKTEGKREQESWGVFKGIIIMIRLWNLSW